MGTMQPSTGGSVWSVSWSSLTFLLAQLRLRWLCVKLSKVLWQKEKLNPLMPWLMKVQTDSTIWTDSSALWCRFIGQLHCCPASLALLRWMGRENVHRQGWLHDLSLELFPQITHIFWTMRFLTLPPAFLQSLLGTRESESEIFRVIQENLHPQD